jgi:hypothetical protein
MFHARYLFYEQACSLLFRRVFILRTDPIFRSICGVHLLWNVALSVKIWEVPFSKHSSGKCPYRPLSKIMSTALTWNQKENPSGHLVCLCSNMMAICIHDCLASCLHEQHKTRWSLSWVLKQVVYIVPIVLQWVKRVNEIWNLKSFINVIIIGQCVKSLSDFCKMRTHDT